MSELELLRNLQTQLVIFFDELIDLLPNEPDLVVVRIFIKDKIPIVDIMSYIAEQLVPLKGMVEKRDDNFFVNHNILFEKLDDRKVNHFKRLWTSGQLDKENKETIWKWFYAFIYLAERYSRAELVHDRREYSRYRS